ncbi:nitrilase-related carbon-nitrogen hydrolase [Desulfosporosinus meridiei]|uniref:Putative amidohydrolase n=1 Tax=Desulfosporosinus meridiei (strain ATCC BAA-275 / DSM 13257 / KCTC 12902 / NCIMB 13706 / S10) TaxID=768704 RepID=J7IZJ0_DESMD|nr:nitrilase-related carbon-nitrogen hydrolase [Desulfosporosinus meridiei]AFQ44478.1 putative amidohydrolase [Desulfosporosinus meridiei DSM 13257]
MKDDCRIGLVQMESIVGETGLNFNNIIHLAENAQKQEVSLLCFPECALNGYSPNHASEIANSLESTWIKHLRECSMDLGLTLLVGMVEQKSKEHKPYISHVILTPGEEPKVYRKVHLGRSELEFFSPGDNFPVFTAHGTSFAVGICWDWHFPETAAIYSLKGAEVLFAPHASPLVAGDRKEIWMRYLGARAYDNSVYIGACNLVGNNGKSKNFSGGAIIVGPKGDLFEKAQIGEDGILAATLSAERINHIRRPERTSMRDSFFLADRRKELYRELIELDIIDR